MSARELVENGELMRYCATNIYGYVDIYDRIEERYMGYHFAYYDKNKATNLTYELEDEYRESLK